MGCKTRNEKCCSFRWAVYSVTLPFLHFHIKINILLTMFSKCLKGQSWSYVKLKNRSLFSQHLHLIWITQENITLFFPERHLFPKRLTSALVRQLTQQLKQHKDYGQHVKPFYSTSGFWCFKTIPNPYEEKKRRKQSNMSLKIHYKVISLGLVRR